MKTSKEGEWEVFKLPRNFTQAYSIEMYSAIKEHISKGNTKFIADASNLSLLDTSAVGLLVKSLKQVQAVKGTLLIRNLHDYPLELLKETDIYELFSAENNTSSIAGHPLSDFKTNFELFGNTGVFHLSGAMTYPKGVKYFKKQILLAMSNNKEFVLDFKDLISFDSPAIGELVRINTLLKQTGGSLRICNTKGVIKEFLENLDISRIIPVYKDIKEALNTNTEEDEN